MTHCFLGNIDLDIIANKTRAVFYSKRGLLCFGLIFLAACQKQVPVVEEPTVTPEEPPLIVTTSDAPEALAHAENLYEQGLTYLEAGALAKAAESFDEALTTLLECQLDDPLTVDFDLEIEDLLTRIHWAEVAYAPEMIEDGPAFTNAVLDDLLVELPEEAAGEAKERSFPDGIPDVSFDLPVEYNDTVASFIEAFTTRRAHIIGAGLERSTRYLPMMRRIFKEEGVPLDLCYLPLIESAYRSRARSRASAMGLWQFMRGTGRMYDLDITWWRDKRLDPELSTRAAAQHLRDLYDRFGDWYLVLAAYNAGGGRVNRAIRRGRTKDFWEMRRRRLLPRETRGYIPAFLAGLYIAKDPEAYGFSNLNYMPPLEKDWVEVDFALDLEKLAERMEVPLETLVIYNPSLIRDMTPHNEKTEIAVPKGRGDEVREILASLPPEQRQRWVEYRLQRGDTLGRLAQRYGTTVRALQDANSIRNPRRLRIGQKLMIPVGGTQAHSRTASTPNPERLDNRKIAYRIKRGDTLYHLARRYQTTIPSIMELNPDLSPVNLRLGQEIRIHQGDRFGSGALNTSVQKKRQTTYVVRKGDFPANIARRFGVSTRDLMAANGLGMNATIYPGQSLNIPGKSSQTQDVIVHVVRRGDSLSKIARRYGTSVGKLQTWNQLNSRSLLQIGQRILIYR
jgi:membrane-bound lytic murein transglycosylase D